MDVRYGAGHALRFHTHSREKSRSRNSQGCQSLYTLNLIKQFVYYRHSEVCTVPQCNSYLQFNRYCVCTVNTKDIDLKFLFSFLILFFILLYFRCKGFFLLLLLFALLCYLEFLQRWISKGTLKVSHLIILSGIMYEISVNHSVFSSNAFSMCGKLGKHPFLTVSLDIVIKTYRCFFP